MPYWLERLAWAAAALTAGGIVWTKGVVRLWHKVVTPIYRGIRLLDEMRPMLPVLNEIAQQFKTDSGSSLRDAVDGLTKAANRQDLVAQRLERNLRAATIQVEVTKELAAQDRAALAHLLVLLDRLNVKGEEWAKSSQRVESHQKAVAMDLVLAQAKVDGVADDLDRSHDRADAVTGGVAGAAADAAARGPDDQRMIDQGPVGEERRQ